MARAAWQGVAWLWLLGCGGMAAAAEPPTGQALFRQHCGVCHLAGGTGTFMLGRRLGAESALLENRTNLDAAYVRTVARHGIASMPRFSRAELPEAQLASIAQYLTRTRP